MYLSPWGIGFWLIGICIAVYVVYRLYRLSKRGATLLRSRGKDGQAAYVHAVSKEIVWTVIAAIAVVLLAVAVSYFLETACDKGYWNC